MTIDANLLKELHLERLPKPRADVPIPRANINDATAMINHRKALSCVDRLETAAFERFIPDSIVIDNTFSAESYVPGWTYAICVPTDRPAPVNDKVTLATGITSKISRDNQFIELAICLKRAYDEYGARSMSPPLIWRTSGAPDSLGRATIPLIGAIVVFDRRKTEMNDVGMVAPKEDITKDRIIELTVDENDSKIE